jgi:sugar/nucleoside kinase (ribokinase family)
MRQIPARPLSIDPTGAGDTYSISYLAARSQGHEPTSAARRATAITAAVLTGRVR